MNKPWQDETVELADNGAVLKPWEHGFDAEELPTEPATRRARGTGSAETVRKRQENIAKNGMQHRSPQERSDAAKKAQLTKAANKAARQERLVKRVIKGSAVDSKHFLTAHEKMEQYDFDPMDLLMNVAQGKALYDDHPFLPVLRKYLGEIEERLEFEDGYGVKGLMSQLNVEACGYLVDSYTPKEHRINVAKELLQYARPKLKQTEHITKNAEDETAGQATPLTEEDVLTFEKWFNLEY